MTERDRENDSELRAFAGKHGVAKCRDDASRTDVSTMVAALRSHNLAQPQRNKLEALARKWEATYAYKKGMSCVSRGIVLW